MIVDLRLSVRQNIPKSTMWCHQKKSSLRRCRVPTSTNQKFYTNSNIDAFSTKIGDNGPSCKLCFDGSRQVLTKLFSAAYLFISTVAVISVHYYVHVLGESNAVCCVKNINLLKYVSMAALFKLISLTQCMNLSLEQSRCCQ